MWDPDTYLRFADERSRPFFDLLARVPATDPATVVDLGCGPGTLTAHLRQRWPAAAIQGLDSSPEMIAAARAQPEAQDIRFEVGDVRDWHPTPDVGVVIANAVLQWVSEHEALLARWADELPAKATLAFQVPGNFNSPSHVAIREVAALPAWRDRLVGVLRGPNTVLPAAGYADLLARRGLTIDAWETTYLHELAAEGDDHPVMHWVEGTALRPVRSTLDDAGWAAFRAELNPRLAAAYPVHNGRVWFPFRRIFVVARR
ncbi:MAG: trans-aconitate 2-methyltransferase [Micromonosporaceae bacterium]|nr:trans-aconitate 2-methyltransferase [Micromonosporaceae bacterium]